MYDMAHVLGLVGPHFQEPFSEGADLVTGSTHKTYFGTQRGIISADCDEGDLRYPLWEAVRRRAFPGSVSNHHLGTMLGLLMSAYEMNHFKDEYQTEVLANAKALARALHDCGLDVAGDPADSFTETHQVIVKVGYAKAPRIAQRLEANNIVVNYQALPEEEGFTASGGLRLGVSEMTRFGMGPDDLRQVAQLIHDVVVHERNVKEEVASLRRQFVDLGFCFKGGEYDELIGQLHKLI
jgi:aminomethyltransferase